MNNYLKNLYERTMDEAYNYAHDEIIKALASKGECLDCGAGSGHKFRLLEEIINYDKDLYFGIDWSENLVFEAERNGLRVNRADLNKNLPFDDEKFQCIFGLSVIEHLINPCQYLRECFRCLKHDGTLVILTPNISTFFTVIQLLLGRMPSSGPHPDANILMKRHKPNSKYHNEYLINYESQNPEHRHMIVFSYRVLREYLIKIGFNNVSSRGFGLYPFPNIVQPILEKLDPYHCHQMVFIAKK